MFIAVRMVFEFNNFQFWGPLLHRLASIELSMVVSNRMSYGSLATTAESPTSVIMTLRDISVGIEAETIFFFNITLFRIIFSEGEGTIDYQSCTSHTYTMILDSTGIRIGIL